MLLPYTQQKITAFVYLVGHSEILVAQRFQSLVYFLRCGVEAKFNILKNIKFPYPVVYC